MYLFVSIILCSFVITIDGAAKVPSYFKQCDKDAPEFFKCLQESARGGLSEFLKGDPTIHMVSANPLKVPEMDINVDGNLKINLTNSEISGLPESQITGLRWDFENKVISIDFFVAIVNLVGTYDISGRILILPINGVGPCNFTFVNTDFKCKLFYEEEERHGRNSLMKKKKGMEYVHFVKSELSYVPERAYFKLDNLFGGNPTLGAEMNKFLDEKWKEVNGEIGVRVGDALGEVMRSALQGMFYKIPIVDLFS